jgi:hypothetical protein
LVDAAGCRACFFKREFGGRAFIGFIAFLGFIGIIGTGRDSARFIGCSNSWRG